MIATESRDGISIVRLDRSAQRNAMVPAMLSRLVDELRRAPAVARAVILTGNGPSFCAGADLKWLAVQPDPATGVAELVAVHHLAISTIVDMPIPVIAAINGAVAGGGLGLALACDYTMAADTASFTTAYFRLGLTPDGGASAFLEQALGPARTREMLLTNRRLSAKEAFDWHLINHVVPADQLIERAVSFARDLQTVPPYTLRQTRHLLDTINLKNQLQLESVVIRTAARGAFFRRALDQFARDDPE